jgi:flagellar motor switch protein FliN/FliY
MADDALLNQNEIEKLLSQGSRPAAPPAAPAAASGGAPLGQADIESLLQSPAPKNAPAAAPPAEDKLLGQNDIEELLNQAGKVPITAPPKAVMDMAAAATNKTGDIPEKDIEFLLNQAEEALNSIDKASGNELPQGVHAFRLEELRGSPASADMATLDLIRDVELDLKIELGRTQMYLEDVLKLRRGSVVALDKLAGDPVDIYVNGRLIARGEVLVMNDNFCVRVAELISGSSA